MRTPMNATARNDTDATLAETAHHDSPRGVPRLGPEGIAPLPQTSEKAAAPRYTFASGSRPLDGFTIKRAIGRGGFGEVYYATSDAGKEVALKLITRNLEVERRGVVPPRAVVLPGVRQKDFPAGTYGLPCALIVGERSESTDLKTSLNDVLREYEIAV